MKSTRKNYLVMGMGATILIFIAGCASFSPEKVAAGKYFYAYYGNGDYDASKPLDEQAVLINLTNRDLSISYIDGKKARDNFGAEGAVRTSIITNGLTVLKPGAHNIGFYLGASDSVNIYEGRGNLDFTFEPGQYYFVDYEAGGGTFSPKILNLADYEEVGVYGTSVFTNENVPVSQVIEGIHAAIERGFMK